jgi:hypothetical protein
MEGDGQDGVGTDGWRRGVCELRIMNEFKSYAIRELNRLGVDSPERKRWARHGSTRWLWKNEEVRNALQYVIDEQCEFMALFGAKEIERDPSVFKLGFSEWATGVL